MGQSSSHVLDSLVEVKGELGFTKDILLLLERLSQTNNNFLLRFNLFDSISLLLCLDLDLALEILIKLLALFSQPLNGLMLLSGLLPVLLTKHFLFILELLHKYLIKCVLLSPALQIDTLLLIFLHLDAAQVSHKTLHEPLNLPVEVYIFM